MGTVLILLVSAGAYLVLAGETSTTELIAAAPVAALTTFVAARLRRVADRPLAASIAWAPIVARGIGELPGDCLRVAGVLARAALNRPRGEVGRIEAEPIAVAGDPGRREGLCAAHMLGRSVAPNSFALDAEDGAMRLHVLAGRR
jgi:hypothetical protein